MLIWIEVLGFLFIGLLIAQQFCDFPVYLKLLELVKLANLLQFGVESPQEDDIGVLVASNER